MPFIAMMLTSAVPVVPSGRTFACTPTRVWDGDGPLWCAEGPRVRIAGIAARERDGSCRRQQPCPAASADAARASLVRLVGTPVGRSPEGHVIVRGAPLVCVSLGGGRGVRTAAWCRTADGRDLSCEMKRSGTVLRWPRYWRNHRC